MDCDQCSTRQIQLWTTHPQRDSGVTAEGGRPSSFRAPAAGWSAPAGTRPARRLHRRAAAVIPARPSNGRDRAPTPVGRRRRRVRSACSPSRRPPAGATEHRHRSAPPENSGDAERLGHAFPRIGLYDVVVDAAGASQPRPGPSSSSPPRPPARSQRALGQRRARWMTMFHREVTVIPSLGTAATTGDE